MELYQASAPETIRMDASAFEDFHNTRVFWLGNAGVMINCHGTVIVLDPLLLPKLDVSFGAWTEKIIMGIGDDDPSHRTTRLLREPPLALCDIPKVDAVCYSHADDDHFGHATAVALAEKTTRYYAPHHVMDEARKLGINSQKLNGLSIGECFFVGPVKITTVVAYHSYQQGNTSGAYIYQVEDCCGYLLDTPDGRIWFPGDTRLLHEHLQITDVDLMFIDFSDNPWHWGRRDALRIANHMAKADLIMYHYGTIHAPLLNCYNADPDDVRGLIQGKKDRLKVVGAGKEIILQRKK